MKKPKIFAFINSETSGFLHVVALAEDGNCLSGHASSNVSFAKHDIGLTSDWKHENYDRHYPDGWDLEWVDDPLEEIKTNEKLKLAFKRNEELGKGVMSK